MAINSKYFRTRRYARLRHGRKTRAFITGVATALAATAASQTVTVLRTVNSKAEGLVTFGGQVDATSKLTIAGNQYSFVTALTEVAASATLTNDATNVTAADTVTIDGVVYTFKSSLTEVKAAGTLTNDGTNVTDGDTVTIGSKVYTLQGTLTNVDGHVKIGASNTATMTNLFHAINASGGVVGTDYATATVANTQVVATNPTGTTVVLTAIVPGTAANSIATTETSTHLAFGTATLTGGVASVANEVKVGASNTASMTNLFEAITAGANAGTDYSFVTTAHATVTATNPTGTTVKATAKTTGTAGNLIAVSDTSSHLTWGASVTTLSGGIAAVANQVLVDDTAAHSRDNLMNAINGGAGSATKFSTGTIATASVVASASSGNLLLTAASALTRGKDVKLAAVGTNLTSVSQLDGPQWVATGHAFVDGEGPCLLTNSGGALPAGSPTGEVWVHVIDSSHIALATSLGALRNGIYAATTDAGSGTTVLKRSVVAQGIFDVLKRNKPRTVKAAIDIDSLR